MHLPVTLTLVWLLAVMTAALPLGNPPHQNSRLERRLLAPWMVNAMNLVGIGSMGIVAGDFGGKFGAALAEPGVMRADTYFAQKNPKGRDALLKTVGKIWAPEKSLTTMKAELAAAKEWNGYDTIPDKRVRPNDAIL